MNYYWFLQGISLLFNIINPKITVLKALAAKAILMNFGENIKPWLLQISKSYLEGVKFGRVMGGKEYLTNRIKRHLSRL